MKKVAASLLIIITGLHFASAQQAIVIDSAFSLAKEKNKMVLLVFSGSDWCKQCIRFQKNVLNDPAFNQYADSNLILVRADFPQTKKLSPETIKRNESLAERYNPSGLFPHIVLLQPDQKVIAYLNYSNENSREFITMISQNLP